MFHKLSELFSIDNMDQLTMFDDHCQICIYPIPRETDPDTCTNLDMDIRERYSPDNLFINIHHILHHTLLINNRKIDPDSLNFIHTYLNSCTYENVPKELVYQVVGIVFPGRLQGKIVKTTSHVRQEQPCHRCGKRNDVGVNTCWWCGSYFPI